MSEKNIKSRIVHKHDIEANWLLATNFSPRAGEFIIYDPDENNPHSRVKIGDGKTNVNDLPFIESSKADKATEADHATTADKATSADKATTADSATTAGSATKATQDGNGKVISDTYETKSDATAKLNTAKGYTDSEMARLVGDTAVSTQISNAISSANSYADSAATKVKNDLLNGAGAAYDTLKELGDLIDDNTDAIGALETVATGKANASDVAALQTIIYQDSEDHINIDRKSEDYMESNLKITGRDIIFTNYAMDEYPIIDLLSSKSDHGHTHDDRYYTETEVNTKFSTLVGDISVATQISNAVAQKSAVQIVTWEADD